ncbi:MAG TPA: 3-hydroxyacyl-CoA dehydrogenase [Caulobacteraceae bacterium]|nr:3-hydroxyacyl-CoA dehydrogenase [Caulobacteraceae bacterium]
MSGSVRRAGVVGAGAMGAGIAQVAAQAGVRVSVTDLSEDALARGRAGVEKALADQVRKGRLEQAAADAVLGRIVWSTDLAVHADADLVVEAVVEDQAVKAALFARLEELVGPEAILATNTSSLSVTGLARGLARPDRFVGMHFFNPAPVMKLVEVVSGAATDPAAADAVFAAAKAWDKTAVRVRDVPGFIVNRVARPFYGEGLRAWGEGVGEPADIDHALKVCAGFRMGPLELADLIGHDVNAAVARSIYDAYFGRTRFVPQQAQLALVEAGRLGRKTGSGVYAYGGQPPAPRFVEAAPVSNGAAAFTRLAAGETVLAGEVLIAPADGRSAGARAAEHGGPVALIDWTRDLSASETTVFAASDERAQEAAAGLAAAAGKQALLLRDRPGGLVLRTLAQLANGAADAVRDRVAEPADIDRAMLFGANYPQGPLAWADQVGAGFAVRVLDNLAHETGEEMYRPGEVLRRAAVTGRPLLQP